MTVLLLDGNVGIGGDPVRLLRRCHELLAPDGTVVVEVEAPGTGRSTYCARLELGAQVGPWFAWSVVGVDALADLAAAAGLTVRDVQHAADEDRWFAHLTRSDARDEHAVA